MNRTTHLPAALFFCILVQTAAILAADPPAKTGENRDTLLYVKTAPPGAKVFLDGKEIGSSDGVFHVAPGVGSLHVELNGHKPTDKQITIRAEGVTRIELSLKPQEEAADVIRNAITTISQCAETDPRLDGVLKSLQTLKESEVVAGMVPYFDSSSDTTRRSAIFVLWKCKFSDITPAVAGLQKLLSHEEVFTRGMAALALGQNKIAASYDALVKMTKDDENAYARRCAAIALGWLGDDRAAPTLEAAMKDSDPTVRQNAKFALMMLRDKKLKGDKTGENAIANDGDAALLSEQGWSLWKKGQLVEAAAKFKQAVKIDPKNANTWNGLGWASFNSGKLPDAEEAFKKVLEINANHPAALNGLGQLYLAQKKYDLAEKYLLKAAPQAPAAWFGLTRLYLLQGKFEQAEKYAQMIEDSGQGSDESKRWLKAAKEKNLPEGLRRVIEPPAVKTSTSNTTVLPQKSPQSDDNIQGATAEQIAEKQRLKARARMRQDAKNFSNEQLREIESLYQIANRKWQTQEAKDSLEKLVEQYKNANRTGCAILYLGQMSRGDEQITYLKQAIADHGDCYYGDGVQVGAFARLLLSQIYSQKGEKVSATKLLDEIRKDYPESVGHNGNLLIHQLSGNGNIDFDGNFMAAQLQKAKSGDYWAKYKLWAAYHKGTNGVQRNPEEAKKWLDEVVKDVYIAKFKPVKPFAPRTPQEFLANFSEHSSLRSESTRIGGASFFRTTVKDGLLIGSFLTEYPDEMRKAIAENPSIELVSIEKLTPEVFVAYEASPQESIHESEKAADTESTEALPMRTWSDSSGAFSVEAGFGGVENGKVLLKKADGKTSLVPLDKLSNEDRVFVANLTKADSPTAAASDAKVKPQELSHDNGKKSGILSINGGGHAVRFKVDGDSYVVTSVSLHGSRYGEPRPPKENFKVWICDMQFKPIATFDFPYSSYTRENAGWKNFRIKPTPVPQEFIVCFGFNPHQTKGVYVSYDDQPGQTSSIGVPGQSDPKPFTKGNWLIRCKVEKR